MLHVDIPTRPEIRALIETRADACVSIYLSTTPQTEHVTGSRIALGNLTRTALEQLEAAGLDKRRHAALQAELDALREDDDVWRLQARSLAVLATPDSLRTFRLSAGSSRAFSRSARGRSSRARSRSAVSARRAGTGSTRNTSTGC